jgi:hypothetical protein
MIPKLRAHVPGSASATQQVIENEWSIFEFRIILKCAIRRIANDFKSRYPDGDAASILVQKTTTGGNNMAASVHSTAEIGRTLLWIAGIVAFVVVALTWVPDWISPEGTNGTGNRGGIEGAGVGSTARMIK